MLTYSVQRIVLIVTRLMRLLDGCMHSADPLLDALRCAGIGGFFYTPAVQRRIMAPIRLRSTNKHTSSRNGRFATTVRACGCAVNRGDWSPLRVSSFCIAEQMRPGRYIGDVVRRSSALERHLTRIHRARRARPSAEAAGGASAERECAIAGQMSLTAPQGVRGSWRNDGGRYRRRGRKQGPRGSVHQKKT